ncbi:MAG: hypothetical protein ACLVCH_13195 [Roseburia inulinivorans]
MCFGGSHGYIADIVTSALGNDAKRIVWMLLDLVMSGWKVAMRSVTEGLTA